MKRTAMALLGAVGAVVLVGVCARVAGAGDLDPPPGAVAPTMKTLDEVEPRIAVNDENTPGDLVSTFRISASGSYYLAGNVSSEKFKDGILIDASGVTLDLNGFSVVGNPDSLSGIRIGVGAPLHEDIRVHGGVVMDCGEYGLECHAGRNAIYHDLLVSGNGQDGMSVGPASVVERCVARGNGRAGIRTGGSSSIRSCTASENVVDGIVPAGYCSVIGCTAHDNGDDGFDASSACVIAECTAYSNGDVGIYGSWDGLVHHCTSFDNSDTAIEVGLRSTVSDCHVTLNTGAGVLASDSCTIERNVCVSNGGAGIHATGGSNEIVGNRVKFNTGGIDVDGVGNMIVCNMARANGADYDIAAGNTVGEILSMPVGTVTSGNPWANFEH